MTNLTIGTGIARYTATDTKITGQGPNGPVNLQLSTAAIQMTNPWALGDGYAGAVSANAALAANAPAAEAPAAAPAKRKRRKKKGLLKKAKKALHKVKKGIKKVAKKALKTVGDIVKMPLQLLGGLTQALPLPLPGIGQKPPVG
jgi:hypothetical protein